MNVNRIEPISVRTIQWQMLTAREILDYKNSGIEVPDVYLSWAQNFISTVNAQDVDTVTYERANAIGGEKNLTTVKENEMTETEEEEPTQEQNSIEDTINQSSEVSDTGQITVPEISDTQTQSEESSESEEQDPYNGNKAKKLREDMKDKHIDLRAQALVFIGNSVKSAADTVQSIFTMNTSSSDSDAEVDNLDKDIEQLIKEVREKQNRIKENVDKINNNESSQSTITEINKLQREITQLGTEGQMTVSDSVTDLNGMLSEVDAQTEPIQDATNFGSETIDIGQEVLKKLPFNYIEAAINKIIGRTAITTGGISLAGGTGAREVQRSVNSSELKNISEAEDKSSMVEDETGVKMSDIEKETGNNDESDTENINSDTDLLKNTKMKALEQTDSDNEQEDIAERNDPVNQDETYEDDEFKKYYENTASLDDIIKRKIRKGEDINISL